MDRMKMVLLHGARQFPPAEALLGRVLKPRSDAAVYDPVRWDREYGEGHWDFLGGPSEAARHAVVATWRAGFAPRGSVLEIGCGAGHLCRLMRRDGYADYLGVDISAAAVARASAELADAQTRFMAADAAAAEIPGQFDAIILNEVLNYFADPRGLVRRLHGSLRPGGILIVSLAMSDIRDGLDKLRIWRAIGPDHTVAEEVALHRQPWPIWTIKALRPLPPPPG